MADESLGYCLSPSGLGQAAARSRKPEERRSGPSRQRCKPLLLDNDLHLRLVAGQANIGALVPFKLLATADKQADKKQQASKHPFHEYALRG